MRSSERAWLALGISVAVYEIISDEDELLSRQVDRWLEANKPLTVAAVLLTAAHLLNLLPDNVDPFHLFSKFRVHVNWGKFENPLLKILRH